MARRSVKPASTPVQPGDFRFDTRVWCDGVMAKYVLDPHHERLLTLAARAWDRGEEAHERLRSEGLTIAGREGLKAHPCISIERDARAAFAALVKQLALD